MARALLWQLQQLEVPLWLCWSHLVLAISVTYFRAGLQGASAGVLMPVSKLAVGFRSLVTASLGQITLFL